MQCRLPQCSVLIPRTRGDAARGQWHRPGTAGALPAPPGKAVPGVDAAAASALLSWGSSFSRRGCSSCSVLGQLISAAWSRSGRCREQLSCRPRGSRSPSLSEFTAPSSELRHKRHLQQLGNAQSWQICVLGVG